MIDPMVGDVFVVDDDPSSLEMCRGFVERLGCTVHAYSEAVSALQDLEKVSPSVLVTDCNMPGMDGLELIGRARQLRPQIQIILVTGREDGFVEEAAVRIGACALLTKPAGPEALRSAIGAALEGAAAALPDANRTSDGQ